MKGPARPDGRARGAAVSAPASCGASLPSQEGEHKDELGKSRAQARRGNEDLRRFTMGRHGDKTPDMSGSDGSTSKARSGDRKGDAARADRLGAALRENLKRRKSQARGRSQSGPEMEQAATHDSAGIVQEKSRDKSKE